MNESQRRYARVRRSDEGVSASLSFQCGWRVYLALAVLVVTMASCAHGRHPSDPSCYVPSIWPVARGESTVTSEFGSRKDPYTGEQRFHKGIDIAAPMKTPVVATAYGRVEDKGSDRSGYGKYVLLEHGNGYETLYAHLSSIEVKKDKYVTRGQVIGKVGHSGRANGSHVQYEVRLDGKPIEPRGLLP